MIPRSLGFYVISATILFFSAAYAVDDGLFDCGTNFKKSLSYEMLLEKFGPENVINEKISAGEEGETMEVSLIYENIPERSLIVYWKNPKTKLAPLSIAIARAESVWKTKEGITRGTTLKDLEEINGGPFTLLGFGFHYRGTVVSWEDGLVEDKNEECRKIIRLSPGYPEDETDKIYYRQLIGDKKFSSTNPAMRALNPKVYSVELHY